MNTPGAHTICGSWQQYVGRLPVKISKIQAAVVAALTLMANVATAQAYRVTNQVYGYYYANTTVDIAGYFKPKTRSGNHSALRFSNSVRLTSCPLTLTAGSPGKLLRQTRGGSATVRPRGWMR